MLELQHRIYLIKCYRIGNVSYQFAINLFHEKYPNVTITRKALKKLVLKFNETGSVADRKKAKKLYNYDNAVTIMAL